MNLILGFAPFILFAVFNRLSADFALWVAFAAAFVVTIRDFVERPSLRLLDCGSLLLFAGLALWRGFIQPDLSLAAVRLAADLGMFALLGGSLLLARPFSLQYASTQSGGEEWPPRLFRRVNYVISLVWVMGFAAMAAADGAVAFNPELPFYIAVTADLLALGLATLFTLRYPAARLSSARVRE